ncbi:MAG: hypothetical protein A2X12_07855 [Bacteroidetes bacterium GWE2_29_8]|nr:MAG: hypothetical protein A2X12_07855 [Bacteroidetes bacterium GWE2_29_8]
MKQFFSILFIALFAINASAQDFTVDGINYNITSANTVKVTPKTPKYFGNIAIPSSVTYNSITYSITSIGDEAFRYCSGLGSITIPNSVTSIGFFAFQNCPDLTSFIIPNSLTFIGDGAFIDCRGLKSIIIPNFVTSIGDGAFSYCKGLKSITISNSITSIGDSAFHGCTGLTSITCNAVIPPALGTDVFDDVPKTIPLYVPSISVDAYKATAQWQDFIVTALPCTAASNMLVNNRTTTSAKLNWDANTGATAYMLRWRVKKGPGQWSYANLTGSETNYTMYGLTQETEYEYQMRTFCGSSYSAFTDLATFWSAYGCGTPTGLTSYAVDKTSGVVKWNGVGGATEFLLRYKKQSDVNWSYIWKLGSEDRQQLGCGSCNIADQLTPNTTYEWQLRAFCAIDRSRFSTFTDIQTFTTLVAKSNNELVFNKNVGEETMEIYPNPAQDIVVIKNYKLQITNGVKVYDVTGRLQSVKMLTNGNTLRIDVKGLSQGVYFIRSNNGFGKFVKE